MLNMKKVIMNKNRKIITNTTLSLLMMIFILQLMEGSYIKNQFKLKFN